MNRLVLIDSGNSLDAVSAGSENPAMENEEAAPIHLRRIDPSQNMRRFYTLAIQPTLFGGASVVRNWGRIGTNGQSMVETFDSNEEAVSASKRLERMKRRRGYRDCGPA
jgi:predicted DNA-binding WGR domain protein